MNYLHSIDLSDWYSCYNLSVGGILTSAKIINAVVQPNLKDLKNINPLQKAITSTPTPTGQIVLMNTDAKRRSIEIDFENYRNKNHEDTPSRLNTLYVAEDTPEGKEMLLNMFKDENSHRKILTVTLLPNARIHKADKRWYEEYYEDKKEIYIKNYWEGTPYNDNSRWEFLVEGSLKITKKDIIFLRKHCLEIHSHILGKDIIEIAYKINEVSD